MQRRFNITGACDSKRHFMVDITHRLDAACQMVERGDYFSVNRARQYGKTTMLQALSARLRADYLVVATSFQKYSSAVQRLSKLAVLHLPLLLPTLPSHTCVRGHLDLTKTIGYQWVFTQTANMVSLKV